ncbi:MAG: hypothetical protein Q4F10_09495 [Corynebacterium glutamicum]|nr:hypothetical protein [Corynebacterium glutamicum]
MTVALTFGQLLTAASSFVVNLLSSSVLLPEARGSLALLLQITYLFAIIAVLGVERPFLRRVQGSFQHALRSYISLTRIGSLIVFIPALGAIFYLFDRDFSMAVALFAMGFFIVFNTVGKGVRVASIASSDVKIFVVNVMIVQIGTILMAVLLAGFNVKSATVWYLGYTISGALVLVLFLVRSSSVSPPDFDPAWRKEIRSAGLRLLPASFGNTAMVRSDRLILPVLAGTAQLGIYTVVATVMEIATWPIKQWVDSSLHRWSQSQPNKGLPLSVVLKTGALAAAFSALLSVVLGLVAFASIEWFFPEEYAPATNLIVPLGVASVVYAVSRTQQGMLVAEGYAGRVSFVELSGMIFSVGAYLVLIPPFGALGAAYGSIIGYFITVLVGLAVHIFARRGRSKPQKNLTR